MPRYYFHLTDGSESVIDPDGREIADGAQIALLALQEARAIIGHDALGGRIDLDQCIEVRDLDGKLIHKLAFPDAITIIGPA